MVWCLMPMTWILHPSIGSKRVWRWTSCPRSSPGWDVAVFFSIFWDFIVCFCWSLFQLLNVMQKSGKYIFCFAFYYNTTFDLNLRERVWNCTASLITGPSSNIQIHAISQSHVACFELLCIPVALELFLFQRMTFSGRLAIPLRSHHGSKWLLTRVSSFWASGGHRSGSASGSWTRLCSFTGIVTCDPQAQRRAEVCSGPLQEEAAWSQGQLGLIVFKDLPIRWLRGNWGGVPKEVWDAACLRIEYYWMQVASSSINVQVLAFFLHVFTRHPVTHAIFNLPAMGVELLDCFRGLDYVKQNLPRPLVPRPFWVPQWGNLMKWFGLFQTRRNSLLQSADDQGTKWDST